MEDLTEIVNKVPILKIALYHPESSEQFIYPKLEAFENNFLMKISGENWLDLSNLNSNKGVAVSIIQEYLKVLPKETVVFGDYLNDVEMLERAYFSYAMKNAYPKVKAIARFETASQP